MQPMKSKRYGRGSGRFPLSLLVSVMPLSGTAVAGSLNVPEIQIGKPVDAMYRCAGGKTLKVTYFNGTNGQSFALVPVDNVPTLMVSTVSADGVRYQSGFMTWWSKGRGGNLYDTRVDANEPTVKGCTSK